MIRLGVNIDHVATLRNARGETYPSPVQAAAMAELGGADNITCHLREDRRHIKDSDLFLLKETINIPLNFEMAATDEMVEIALKVKPHAVTLVPEKREELTTEGGLDMEAHKADLKHKVSQLKDIDCLVSMFIEANDVDIELSKEVGADAVEFHTGHYCTEMNKAKTTKAQWELIKPFHDAAKKAKDIGLQVHFGHGLNYTNAQWMQTVPYIEEANIGHSIVSKAVFVGLESAVREMKQLLNDTQFKPVEI